MVTFCTLQFYNLIQDVPEEARETEVFLKMILHVVPFLTKEDSFDELVEVFVVVADESLDLACLSMCYDLVLDYLTVSNVWEH